MLFNLFGKKENPLGEQQYEYVRIIDGNAYTITVDLTHEEAFLERKTYANIIVVAFTLLKVEGEHDRLTDSLLDLSKSLRSITKAIFVGTIRDTSMLIGYIATINPVEEASVIELLGKHKQSYTVALSSDPGWVFLTPTLYPTAAERQHMSNIGLVSLVKAEQGHDAIPPNGVEHSLAFKNIESGKSLLKDVEPVGYYQIGMQSTQDRTYPLMFVLGKRCDITLNEINAQTDYLIGLVEKYNGRYDGWQAHQLPDRSTGSTAVSTPVSSAAPAPIAAVPVAPASTSTPTSAPLPTPAPAADPFVMPPATVTPPAPTPPPAIPPAA